METRKPTAAEIAVARKEAMFEAMSVNNVLTVMYLETKTDAELLCFVHPIYRELHAKRMGIEWKPKVEPLVRR